MRTTPHVGDSVYTPERTVDSNRRGSASQRTRLTPVSNRVDRLDGSAGRVPPPLTMRWVEEILTGYGCGFLEGNHELPNYFTTTLSPFGKPHSSDGCTGSMMPIHINDDNDINDDNSATTMLLDGVMKNGEVLGRGG